MTPPLLPSWRPGATRDAITGFLDAVDQIPPEDRVAVFDNDGTMWCEKPSYVQLDFFLHELRKAVAVDPALGERPEYRAILDNDKATLNAIGLEGLATALLDLFVGLTPAQFDGRVRGFLTDQFHPGSRRPYRQLRYQPMLELLAVLRERGFGCYVATAGGTEFVRVISRDFYGIGPEGVVGSQIDYDVGRDPRGRVVLTRTNRLVATGPNEGLTKVANIRRILGRRPVVAGGNSAGDAEMLEYAQSYDGPSMALLIDHDDPLREYAYQSVAGTFETTETILETADRLAWTVVSIEKDWSTVFVD